MNFRNLREFMNHLTDWKIPGNLVIVKYKGKEVFRYSSGYSDVETKTKMTGIEWVNAYSCSKPVTVTAAMQLYEKGLFLLDDPIWEYIPEFKEMYVGNEKGEVRKAETPVTFRHLFTMSAGLTYDLNSNAVKLLKKEHPDGDTVTVAKYLAKDPLKFEPGSRYEYSMCHDVLAALVEIMSGMTFGEYVKQNIFAPLGFEGQVTYKRTPEVFSKMASQYVCTDSDADGAISSPDGQVFWKKKDKNSDYVLTSNHESGGAGMVISPDAYIAFADALAHLGKCPGGERILAEGTVNLIRTSQNVPYAKETFNQMARMRGYEYGLGVRTLVSNALSGSNGSLGEFGWDGAGGCYTIIDPQKELSLYYAQQILNLGESDYIQTRMRNIVYSSLD